MKQAKSNLNRWNLEYRGISNRPGIQIMEVGNQRYSQYLEIGLRESDLMSEVTRG